MSGSAFPRACAALAVASVLASGAGPAAAAEPGLVDGFAAALRGCETWVLDPTSWRDGPQRFVASMTGAVTVSRPQMIPDRAQPPAGLRRGNEYWRVSGPGRAGFFLITSTEIPMCHIVGDAQGDYGSSVAAVLASARFVARWERSGERAVGGRIVTTFLNRTAPDLELTVSRPAADGPGPGGEVTATARALD